MRRLLFAAALIGAAGCASTNNPDTAGDIGGAVGAGVSGVLTHAPVVGSVIDSVDTRRAKVGEWRQERRDAKEAERVKGMHWQLCVAHPDVYGSICRERFAEFRDFLSPPISGAPAADAVKSSPPAAAPSSLNPTATLMDRVRRHEGFRQEPYRDTGGVIHVGYGHNLEANRVLIADLRKAQTVARDVVGEETWARLNQTRQDVLTEMAFTLGSKGLSGFRRFLAAVHTGNWTVAAFEMADSLWAQQQGVRAIVLAEWMRKGG